MERVYNLENTTCDDIFTFFGIELLLLVSTAIFFLCAYVAFSVFVISWLILNGLFYFADIPYPNSQENNQLGLLLLDIISFVSHQLYNHHVQWMDIFSKLSCSKHPTDDQWNAFIDKSQEIIRDTFGFLYSLIFVISLFAFLSGHHLIGIIGMAFLCFYVKYTPK